MKTLIATLIAIASLNAFAVTIPVYEGSTSDRLEGSFGINEKLGRAWVEVAVSDSFASADDSGPSYERVLVPGMSIVGGSVVLDVEGQQVECAKIRTVGLFRYRAARATGNCKFSTRVERRTHDNGFEIRTRKVQVLLLTTK